ncbi:lipoyltransferase 1, mitochondrial [Elysia marginata]|uniref:Lipoyltransferase 1, mitochondrial n=1 Tax=Elysia marginata TaxID=1093978 RepID=A0AAV4J0J7_9GAST|nr:lipoyltransferase 1, mitochondrial [Elysia marginata]
MWRNKSAIVSGRHQNPWLEANVPLANSLSLDIARRSSGGGTVYHDEGNLNLSFLKSRENYDRRKNLNLVVQAITNRWDIDLTVNDRDDILLNKLYKVSGTAAKLGRLQSYHHFTLLHSVNQELLQKCLTSPMQGASSKATRSFPSSVMNLADQEPDITFDSLIHTIGKHFLAELGQEVTPETFRYINPLCEEEFPGVSDLASRLRTWDWRFGKSPDFSIERNFTDQNFKSHPYSVKVKLTVSKGALNALEVKLDNPELEQLGCLINQFCVENLGFPLKHDSLKDFENKFCYCFSESTDKQNQHVREARWVLQCILSCLDFL